MVVAGIKIGDSQVSKPAQITLGCSGFSELIVPRAAVKLAMFRHAVSKDNILEADPKVVIMVNRRQVETMILFEVVTVSADRGCALMGQHPLVIVGASRTNGFSLRVGRIMYAILH